MKQSMHPFYFLFAITEDYNVNLPMLRMAPESIKDGKFNSRSDVWSYGVLLMEMTTRGGSPYCMRKGR